MRAPASDRGIGPCAGARRHRGGRITETPHRLHDPAILALRGSVHDRESVLHRRHLRHIPAPAAQAHRIRGQRIWPGGPAVAAGGDHERRAASAPGPRGRHAAPAGDAAAGRADQRGRSAEPARVLGEPVRPGRGRHDDSRVDALHGRSGALSPAGNTRSRTGRRGRRAEGTDERHRCRRTRSDVRKPARCPTRPRPGDRDPQHHAAGISTRLREAGLQADIEATAASLEDVFVAATRRQNRPVR